MDRASLAKSREARAIGASRAPLLVASLASPPRDVFWAGSPRDVDLAAFCARRERVERGTLVLVPTSKRVALDVAARFARGEHVEVRALEELLDVRDGKLALRATREEAKRDAEGEARPFGVDRASSDAPVAGIASLLGATRWEDLRLSVVDGHTIRIDANGKSLLRTFVELGFVDGRKRDVVTPTLPWSVLLLFCKRRRIQPSAYAEVGAPFAVKKAIERVGRVMRASFGLAAHPIHGYSKATHEWVARFRVAESVERAEEAARGAKKAEKETRAALRQAARREDEGGARRAPRRGR